MSSMQRLRSVNSKSGASGLSQLLSVANDRSEASETCLNKLLET